MNTTKRDDNEKEREAYNWAKNNQGFEGTYEDWLALSDDDREEYELGAAGIPTA